MALRVAVTLGLPDRLRGEGAANLAEELGVSPVALDLLLAHLTTLGVVERTDTGHRTTGFGAQLCADAGNGLANFLDINSAGGRADLAFVELAHSVATGEAAYPRRYGQDFWSDAAENPHLRETFDKQMTHRFLAQVPQIIANYDWSRFPAIVDVGGGRGDLLAAILRANPGMHGHLVDLDPTASAARQRFDAENLPAEVTAGSFFDPLPAGASAYLLSDIFHDWDDDHSHQILARCVEAAGSTGRILILEPVADRGADTEMNLAMLALYGGRERRVDEFRTLAAAHNLTVDTVTTVSDQRCVLELRPTPPQ